jgi:hypothetical protein
MQYEKLLVKIGKPADEGYEYADIIFNRALRAVVELHNEDVGTPIDDPISVCDYCKLAYPCPTIQVIEKELQ